MNAARSVKRVGVSLAAGVLCVASMGGCHKNTVAYSPTSPPLVTSPAVSPDEVSDIPSRPRVAEKSEPSIVQMPSMKGRPDVVEEGLASWYGPPYHNRKGADGTVYDENALTAAHKTLPLGAMVRVTNLSNNLSVEVRITDRGPFVGSRLIDLSLAAAKITGVYRAGVTKVRVEAYLPVPRPGADPAGRWCVQIGAFLSAEDALQLKNDLLRQYATAKVTEFAGPTGYWVRINPKWPDRNHANAIAGGIHVPDAEAFVVRTD